MTGGGPTRQVSLLDLTAAQVRVIEAAVGLPMDQWRQAPKGLLYPHVLAAIDGVDVATFDDVPIGELVSRISMVDPMGNARSARRPPDSHAR